MKTKFKLKSIAYILSIMIMLQIAPNAFAHVRSQKGILTQSYIKEYGDYYIGGEDVGWSIDESCHAEENYVTYHFKIGDNELNNYKDCVEKAANKWAGIATITKRENRDGTGEIYTYYTDINVIAQFCDDYTTNSSGHLISWKIMLNLNNPELLTETAIAHEFGHAIGLNDLYATKNSGKLMYGFYNGADKKPIEADKLGAEVITGQHTSHTWGYTYYSTSSSGVSSHVKYCTYCKGQTNTISNCSYNAANICVYCKARKREISLNSIE